MLKVFYTVWTAEVIPVFWIDALPLLSGFVSELQAKYSLHLCIRLFYFAVVQKDFLVFSREF